MRVALHCPGRKEARAGVRVSSGSQAGRWLGGRGGSWGQNDVWRLGFLIMPCDCSPRMDGAHWEVGSKHIAHVPAGPWTDVTGRGQHAFWACLWWKVGWTAGGSQAQGWCKAFSWRAGSEGFPGRSEGAAWPLGGPSRTMPLGPETAGPWSLGGSRACGLLCTWANGLSESNPLPPLSP